MKQGKETAPIKKKITKRPRKEKEEDEFFDDDHAVDEVVLPPKKRVRRTKEELKTNYVDPDEMELLIKKFYETDVFSSELADMIQKIATRLGYAQNFINYCVDEETEALTQRGWVNGNEINETDKILSYDISTKALVWSDVKSIYRADYTGLMHKLTLKGLDALVTPGHKFVSSEEGLKPVEHIKCKEHITLMGLPVEDNIPIYSDDFVELMGWAVTEGNYLLGKYTHSVQVFQKIGKKANEIRDCLIRQEIPFKEYPWSDPNILGFRIKREAANLIVSLAPNRVLSSEFILSLTQSQRIKLIRTMVRGDGNVRNHEQEMSWTYVQKDKHHIDSFLMLCTLAGLTTSNTLVENDSIFSDQPYYVVNIYNTPKLQCLAENINFNGGRPRPGGDNRSLNITTGKISNPNIPTIEYGGLVWCPETSYGTFIARRGKYIYVTGNSYKEEMIGDAVIKMVTALKRRRFMVCAGYNPFSYFTKVAFRAFQNRIKKEKKDHDTVKRYQENVYNILTESGQIPYPKNTHGHDEEGWFDDDAE